MSKIDLALSILDHLQDTNPHATVRAAAAIIIVPHLPVFLSSQKPATEILMMVCVQCAS
jgi:hypothetical protein